MILRRANGLLHALVLLAVLLLAGFPDIAPTHQNDHAPVASAALHEADEVPVHRSETETAGHCHPGVDCFTAAIFALVAEIVPPAVVTSTRYLAPFQLVDDIRPEMDLPPPRRRS
ncbi:MAG: hypothetical protein CML50_23415 [Rhodobacteraceae bacterium]|jgi:hypothetical protein|uniref:Uncharacterized protein n=1 Tax=Salipiger profundus TaxID=1229727 RepID=A0A1U7D059_9RHOB|nr:MULTISPECIES: hypothetical protein [Salipiger]APX21537.1 hypothetical protein Ga0080559_TMP741 [Salipiger profundus]MAB08939.1 hypothetical protein [Paracoccaceae bacterium]GGA01687.1 hypothetical protein GCM10011326_11180 [Salipiger profundus]SFC16765.1 hypothetical protein SAMN05444415_102273 [Salipiger profundus]